MVANRQLIISADKVANEVNTDGVFKTNITEVRSVMKRDLDMSYKKVRQTALHANSEYNLILRQRYAIKLLSLTQKKTVFLNVDETWLDASEYSRRSWQPKNSKESVPLL